MKQKRYLVHLASDQGKFTLEVIASSKDAAKAQVMRAEGCPSSAIISVSPLRKNSFDPMVRRTTQGYEVSDIMNGYRVHKHYIGYTKKDAVAAFKQEHYIPESQKTTAHHIASWQAYGEYMRSRKNPSVKATVWTYDVWGNARDGYEVNDRSKFGTYDVDPSVATDDKATIRFLKEIGLLKAGVQARSLEFDGDDKNIYVNASRDGYPLCGIEIE